MLAATLTTSLAAAGRQDPPAIGQDGKDVEWVPTPDALVDTMLRMARVTADDVVMDLGSGDGRTVVAAARLGARAVGVEYDPDLVSWSRARAAAAGVGDRVRFVEADLFEVDLTDATVVTMFLLPDLNLKLRPALLDLAPGTRIVSNTWDLGDWAPDETVQLDPCPGFCTALLWIVPASVEGVWSTADGAISLSQRYQTVTGTVRRDDATVPLTDGRLDGARLRFRAGTTDYDGRVAGDTITGTLTDEGRTTGWAATRARAEGR